MSLLLFNNIGYCQSPCDSSVDIIDAEFPYHERGKIEDSTKRCEGFYFGQVSSSLSIVGLIQGELRYHLSKNEIVKIRSTINQQINLRAVSIPLGTFYRMDAQLKPDSYFIWPIYDFIYKHNLSAETIGVYGWIENKTQKFYVPVITQAKNVPKNNANEKAINLIMRSTVKLISLYWRYATIDSTGNCSQPCEYKSFFDYTNEKNKYYNAGEPIIIELPTIEAQELCVDISVKEITRPKFTDPIAIRILLKEK